MAHVGGVVDALNLFTLGHGRLAALHRGKGIVIEGGKGGAQTVGAFGVGETGVMLHTVDVGEKKRGHGSPN